MKKNILLILIYSLIHLSFTQNPMEYNITKSTYIKGTYKILSYELKNDSIVVIRYSTKNRQPKTLYSNVLNAEQKSELIEILNGFNLSKMEDMYVDNNVKGQRHYVYDIKINNDFKSILVSFGEEPNLKKLDVFFNDILPVDKDTWYDAY